MSFTILKDRFLLLLKLAIVPQMMVFFNSRIKGKLLLGRGTGFYIAKNATISVLKGSIFINKKWMPCDPFHTLFSLETGASLIVEDNFAIYSGSKIYIKPNATLILGGGYINHNLNIGCYNRIEIGHNVAISENVTIRDSDNHQILNSNHVKSQPVKIGNHVWIGMNVTILKGVSIGDGAIIAAGSLVNKSVPPRCLAAGVPIKIIKENIDWE